MSDLFRNFHVLEIRAGYEDELTRLTRPDGWGEPGPTLSDGDNRAPFTAILAHARGLGCKSIVIEDDYVDTN